MPGDPTAACAGLAHPSCALSVGCACCTAVIIRWGIAVIKTVVLESVCRHILVGEMLASIDLVNCLVPCATTIERTGKTWLTNGIAISIVLLRILWTITKRICTEALTSILQRHVLMITTGSTATLESVGGCICVTDHGS